MKHFPYLACFLVVCATPSGGQKSATPNPTLGYTATGGRGLGLKLANEDGSAATEVYRFVSGSRFDLSPFTQRKILILDNWQVLLASWTIGSRGVSAGMPITVYSGSPGATAAAFSQDGSKIAYGTSDGSVHILNASTLQRITSLATLYPQQINWRPDGNSLVILTNNPAGGNSLIEHPLTGGSGTILLTEPNINDFDTSRTPGDPSLLVSYSRGSVSGVGVWNGGGYTNLPAQGAPVQGAHVNWNCAQTRITLKNSADEGVYTMDVSNGSKQVIYKGVQGRWPRYMKCDVQALMMNARSGNVRRRF